jgi:polyol transport system permease protein
MGIEAIRKRSNFLWTVLTYLLVFLLVFPVLWMVITGFKTEIAAITIPPTLFFQPTLDQF